MISGGEARSEAARRRCEWRAAFSVAYPGMGGVTAQRV